MHQDIVESGGTLDDAAVNTFIHRAREFSMYTAAHAVDDSEAMVLTELQQLPAA